MILGLNSYNNLEVPSFVLSKPNGERIDTIPCTSKKGRIKFNDYNEISFITYLYIDGKKNDIYNKISELMHIEVPDVGRFVINNITINSEGTKFETKECTAFSEEILLAQKYLELFTINGGTVDSVEQDGTEENATDVKNVQFYNPGDPRRSLLHLVLNEKCPNWSIGHVDNELYEMQRSFQVDRQDIYSFLTQDVSKAFECIFIFDTINHKIHVYAENNVGEDTNIHISYANLEKTVSVSSSTDDIKTCLTVTGRDDLNIREVNMGQDRIINIDYFHSLEYMSQELYDAFTTWKELWNSKVSEYENLVTKCQSIYDQIYECTTTRMPLEPYDPDDYANLAKINWSEYGLNPLKEALAVFENKLAVMVKSGEGVYYENPSNDAERRQNNTYKNKYLPCYNTVESIKNEITVVTKELEVLESNQKFITDQMGEIQNIVDINNYFKNNGLDEELKELYKFIREDELSSENYLVTKNESESSRIATLHELLKYGQKELSKISIPRMEFSMDMINIYAIPEFKDQIDKFDVGNYIYVTLRDDFSLKLRLLTIDVNFLDKNDFSVTFGNIAKLKGNKLFEDVTSALELASSAATTVSFNASYWNKANIDSTNIGKMVSDGLLSAGQRLQTTESDVIIDDRGIIISNNPNSKYKDDVIFLGGGQIVFSDDNLKTIKTALGRVQYEKQGVLQDDFGLIAQIVIAGYIGGSLIEGNTISNGNGTFFVDEDGNLTATSATIKGDIKADKGYIGGENGFIIESGKMYSKDVNGKNKSSIDSENTGVYIGTNGISLGAKSPFKVTSDGKLTATDADIKGKITATSGYIGGETNGFTIVDKALYNGKSSLTAQSSGVYIGKDGISLGYTTVTNSDGTTTSATPFSVTSAGVLTAKSGTIGGATISNDSIKSSNGNWSINSNGSAIFKNVTITGVQSGSSFGGITYSTNGTYGDFSNGFAANTSFSLSGKAKENFDTLVANKISARYIESAVVNAGFITADTVASNYVTTNTLNATTANITGKITAVEGKFEDLEAGLAKVNGLQLGNVKFGLGNHDGMNVVTWVYAD